MDSRQKSIITNLWNLTNNFMRGSFYDDRYIAENNVQFMDLERREPPSGINYKLGKQNLKGKRDFTFRQLSYFIFPNGSPRSSLFRGRGVVRYCFVLLDCLGYIIVAVIVIIIILSLWGWLEVRMLNGRKGKESWEVRTAQWQDIRSIKLYVAISFSAFLLSANCQQLVNFIIQIGRHMEGD